MGIFTISKVQNYGVAIHLGIFRCVAVAIKYIVGAFVEQNEKGHKRQIFLLLDHYCECNKKQCTTPSL